MLQRTHQEDTPFEHLNDGTPPALLTVVGSDAKLEGTFDIADSVQIDCEVGGQLKVGGRLVIGERGSVRADVETVDAIIYGQYKGNMVATGSVEITPTGRVAGKIETNSLVISKGGFFNGKTVKLKEAQADDGPPSGDRRRREGLRAAIQKSSSALREGVVDDAAEDHGLSLDTTLDPDTMATREEAQAEAGPPPAFLVEEMGESLPPLPSRGEMLPEDLDPDEGPPSADRPKRGRTGRARAVPRKGRKGQNKTSRDHDSTAKLKDAQAEAGPPPAFLVEEMGESLPPLPSRGELLPEDLDLDEGPQLGDRPKRGRTGRARAVPRKGRKGQNKTSHDHGPTAKLKEAQAEAGPPPAFLVEGMGETLPPLPSRGELLPEDLDLDEGPHPGDRPPLEGLGIGGNQSVGSALREDDDLGDDIGPSRADWGRQPEPIPDDDPLGIR